MGRMSARVCSSAAAMVFSTCVRDWVGSHDQRKPGLREEDKQLITKGSRVSLTK
jgi:hypothetical protein